MLFRSPFNNNIGTLAGSTRGSISFPSKFAWKSTVSSLMSESNASNAIADNFASVYLLDTSGADI